MILLFQHISELKDLLENLVIKDKITDFRIQLKINNRISTYILKNDEHKELNGAFESLSYNYNELGDIEEISESEKKDDKFYDDIFAENDKVLMESRRRLSNLLDAEPIDKNNYSFKTITFYSYKGGVGRSTTLASCASYLAMHHALKIVIIDCDLEAPGFTNFYLNEPSHINYHNGLVEYIMDSDYLEDNHDLEKYIWEAGKDFSGDGSIYVMSAGNLSDDFIEDDFSESSHKEHYLEGLARVDLYNTSVAKNTFEKILSKIDETISPDLVLIDSRTGFNDIFGLSAFQLSDVVVGFFGNNAQTQPGMRFFIDKINETEKGPYAIIVNSILSLPSSFLTFQKTVRQYIESLTDNDTSPIDIKTFRATRYLPLEMLGTDNANKIDFIDLIKNKSFHDYNEIFAYIHELISDISNITEQQPRTDDDEFVSPENTENNIAVDENIDYNPTYTEQINSEVKELINHNLKVAYKKIRELNPDKSKTIQYEIKRIIVRKLMDNWPSLYGEGFKEDSKQQIFYRRSMEEVFNSDKFIILGNKGTGKTFLYEALRHDDVIEKIKTRASKQGRYEFFHAIDVKQSKFFNTQKFEELNVTTDKNFYVRFWTVFIWNAIMLEAENRLDYKSPLTVYPILDDTTTRNRFRDLIANEEAYIKIEQDMLNLDKHLKNQQYSKNLVIIFDGLDKIVKPINWTLKIVPLIDYWRNKNFSKISPKLFIRSDLFAKLSNINNVKELKNQAISIEWNKEELFGFFFKFVFSFAKNEFLRYMSFSNNISYEFIRQIKQKSGQDNQISLEEYLLKPLVDTFFGKYADIDNTPRYGESYDWFYTNLKNADQDRTISLRPFIDLIKSSFRQAKEIDKSPYPILSAKFYANSISRRDAVQNHFDDLAGEEGNNDLKIVFNYIKEKKYETFVYLDMHKEEMATLLQEVINKSSNLQNDSVDSLINLLKINGIVSEIPYKSDMVYIFAFLYKDYLGLGNRPKKARRKHR